MWVCLDHPDQPHGHLVDGVPCPGEGIPSTDPGRNIRPPVEMHHCFLEQAGAGIDAPCWGGFTRVSGLTLPPDDGGGRQGVVWLCEGHAPVARGEPYRPEPHAQR